MKVGLQKEELRSRTVGSNNQKLFNTIVAKLIQEEKIVQEKEVLRLKEHQVTLAQDQEETRHQIEEIYLKGGLQGIEGKVSRKYRKRCARCHGQGRDPYQG